MGNLEGKIAIVTGASRGIGAAIVKKLAAEGATVVACARSIESCEGAALCQKVDVSDSAQVDACVKATIEKFGKVDILVNNAGVWDHGGVKGRIPFEKIAEEYWIRNFRINIEGTFRVTQTFLPGMLARGYGRIVNIASMYGLVGNKIAPAAPYHAAKGGVVNLTRALAAEWGGRGICVNAICPGYFETPLTKETLESEFFQNYAKTMIPLARYGNEGELDSTAIFLASPASSYVNGQNIAVDGGYTCM